MLVFRVVIQTVGSNMAVYVDNMQAPFGRMIMCHMIADTEEELLEMADTIGIARKWHQYPGTIKSHFDICLSKRKLAVKNGAEEITMREFGTKMRKRIPDPIKGFRNRRRPRLQL